MVEKSLWQEKIEQSPSHSQWYIQRFETMRAQGQDIWGEARVIDAMVSRGARILDAGSGAGRLADYLQRAGHTVVGVDVDAALIEASRQLNGEVDFYQGDLALLPEVLDTDASFDAIVCAGNVVTFLAPSTRRLVLENFAAALAEGGRAVIGFGAGRGYSFDEFFADAEAAGLTVQQKFSTWELHPLSESSTFLVAVLGR
ncbi:bifunctional 2-polyprenyl-6-hydroxyphenol methylase/3-demethylubiquinol 3-O-methyltransferase UbiG [Rothia sp. ZJ1223]|uniref:class I SAM-dependent methyltransferase n=1 Tax=Rothia sp. ZJ1223 TaxID=2811098 RepID=UPI00195C6EE8|nr:class I SAM-dependent methyltransferase [Rothia sp. ZJ1223]MBM7051521.1 class I SAM-dependent methyltransferase [Rothia sp. ZJ1223]